MEDTQLTSDGYEEPDDDRPTIHRTFIFDPMRGEGWETFYEANVPGAYIRLQVK